MEHLRDSWVSHPWEIRPIYEMLNLSMKQHFCPRGLQNSTQRVQQKPGHGQEKLLCQLSAKRKSGKEGDGEAILHNAFSALFGLEASLPGSQQTAFGSLGNCAQSILVQS